MICTDELTLPPLTPSCAVDYNRETMGANITADVGETSLREIEPNDEDSANSLY